MADAAPAAAADAAAPAAAAADGAPDGGGRGGGGGLSVLWTPDPSISYSFLAAVSAVLAAICGVLYGLQAAGVDSVQGFWLVCSPAVPLLMWALLMRSKAARSTAAKKSQ